MADQDYNTKLESLRRYIPFLINMMAELKAKGNRSAQLNKIQSLHDMITDSRKKLKLETLNRCEEVLTNIYFKVNPQSKGPPNFKNLPGIESPKNSTLPGIESPKYTPASPSPPRDVVHTKPVNIPMEKIETPSSGLGHPSSRKSHLPKVNVYSNVVIKPAKYPTPVISAKVPDMSKPPISLDDLKTLEDDVQQKITDATYANASVDDLHAYRKELELQLRIDSITTTMSPEKGKKETINTTVRNASSPSKKLSFSESKSQTVDSRNPNNPEEVITKTNDKKSPKDKDNATKDLMKNKSHQKVVKEDSSIFGTLLSSIDSTLMEDKKKPKKGDRRSSVNLSRDDSSTNSSSTTSLSSNRNEVEAKTTQGDKSKESKDKKSSESHKHRRSSVDKGKHKSKDKSKNETGSDKSKKDKKKSKKEKHKSKKREDKNKSSETSSKGGDASLEIDKDKEVKKPEKVLLSDILLFKSKIGLTKNKNSEAKDITSASNPDCDKNTTLSSTSTDAPKSSTDTTPITVVEKPKSEDPPDVAKTTPIYKRLADKYNPKPKPKIAETEIPDVDKAVSDSIENYMRIAPAKPLLSPLSEPRLIPGERIFEATSAQSNTSLLSFEQSKPVQLPEILQKFFSKPLLGDIIPKRLNENMFPLTLAAQNKAHSLGVNLLTKPGAIHPPEPPILSPPRRPLSFQAPDNPRSFSNFMSPPHHDMGARPNSLLPTPGSQRGILPSPPMPPTLLRGFSDHNPSMEMGFVGPRTPRMDFHTPSTPLPDFDSPPIDYEPAVHLRNEFNQNQGYMPPQHQERQINCFDPRNQNYQQYQPQAEVNVYNNQLVANFYAAGLHNPEMPHYRSEQNFFQERQWHENAHWGRRPGDPRNYKEYKEMRERQEREAIAAQEKQKEIKDPRLAPRDYKDGERDVVRDPRRSRGREKSVDRDSRATSRDREQRERPRSRERALSRLGDPFDSKDSRSRPKERESKFDQMYSKTNKAATQSRPRDDKVDEEESFISPLDSLYNAGEKGRTGRGYGVQKFKIPRKSRVDDVKEKNETRDKRRSRSVGRKTRLVEVIDSSEDSDTCDADNNDAVPENDSDVEILEETTFEMLKDVEKKSSAKQSVETPNVVKGSKKKSQLSNVDPSRIKVIIKSGGQDLNKSEINSWESVSKSLDSPTKDIDLSSFVSEYDKEFSIENNEEDLFETVNEEASRSTGHFKKPYAFSEESDKQMEEPSSSQDVTKLANKSSFVVEKERNELEESGNFIKHINASPTKEPTESVEADSSKKSDGALTPQEHPAKSDEPSEQNILAHFFENLLKSKNKKDKKTALFSLIETFSDSFDSREIQKIRKIIKTNEDEDEESDEESRGGEKEDSIKDNASDTNVDLIPTVATVQEEPPVVGSTTEEEPVEKELLVAEDISKDPPIAAETQVNEVTKSSEELEQPHLEESKSEESCTESNQSDLISSLEPVMVSVGERIKARRRNLVVPAKPRKKGKTELDMLHEDIQDMFIRDGILTATGKRMCRILKDDPTALSVTKPETSSEQPKKGRKKPGPKPKLKINKDELQSSMKDMRVLIKKMPDNVVNVNSSSTRQLRSRNRQSSYAESDDDSQKVNSDQLRSKQSSYADSDNDDKSNNDIDTEFPDDNESRSEIEAELSSESEDDDNTSQTSEGALKPRVRRRRTPKWASGIIPKIKKKKASSRSEENSPSRSPSPAAEPDFDKLVEPDKEYYYDYANKSKITCKLCKYSGLLLTGHYLKEHPQSEVLCSRLAPHVAAEAIRDFSINGTKYEGIVNHKKSTKYHYSCRVCGFTSFTSPIFFYEHVTTHTGEYRHQCGICEYFAVTGKTIAGHFLSAHPDQEKKAIRKTYTFPIVFGYICGECNFLQLTEKSVEDHANIFHLGEKPNIFKINMSTVFDSICSTLNASGVEPKALESKLTEVSTENEALSKSVTGNESMEATSTPSPKKRKKAGPKPKVPIKETRMEEESKDSPGPIFRKKPGPKSKTMFVGTAEEDKASEKIREMSPAAPIRRKPGPKSKTYTPIVNETSTVDEPARQSETETGKELTSEETPLENVDYSVKEAPARKRKRSLDKLLSEDCPDDLDTIITLSSRSSRAAKEKATAKLKTMIENNEGTRKKPDTDPSRKDSDKDKSRSNEGVNEKEAEASKETHKENDTFKETLNENPVGEMHPPSVKGSSKEERDNVFTCKTDLLEEEAKKIEEERLRKMEELNKSIGSRTSKLDFVDKLSNRLNSEESSEIPELRIKQEPREEYLTIHSTVLRGDTPTMPVLEKELVSPVPITRTPPLTKITKSPLATRKPPLEEDNSLPQSGVNFRQNKFNSLFSNMIEKLQGKVNEAAEQQQLPSTSSQAQSEEAAQRPNTPELLISIGDLITATKKDSEIIYSCHANNCYVVTKDKMVFQLHCKFGHKDLTVKSSLCDKCGVVIEITPDTSLLENLYDHLVFAHSDYLTKSSSLRMRRLSGDKLSVKQELSEQKSSLSTEEQSQDFEVALDCHILTKHTVTPQICTETEMLCKSTDVDPAASTETESNIEASTPTTIPADVETPTEESPASEATLEVAEDNPFSFKIANVVSFAKSAESENSTSPIKINPKPPELPCLKPVPPLTLIGIPKQQPSVQPNHLVVKEAKLTAAELTRPKKAQKALQKFIDTPGDLYKCPHYYCMFTSNVRTFLDRHLKAHKSDSEAMVPCVYCDMKTPWEHVPMHIDIRHASCRFACTYCLYRAFLKEYVCLHQELAHPDKEFVILSLPQHKAARKFSVADPKTDYKNLCEPFRCGCRNEAVNGKQAVKEYLFQTEFAVHLNVSHHNKMTGCGYPGCTHRASSSVMLNHWAMFHGVCTYQCGYCKTSSNEISRMYVHFSQQHPSMQSDILVRVNDKLPKDRELGYSTEAFERLGHIKRVPQNLLAAVGKRSSRSIKLLHYSSKSPEDAITTEIPESTSTGTSPVTPLLTVPTLKQVQAVPVTQTQSKFIISNPNLQLLVASTTGGSEQLFLLPASMLSPNKGPSVTSMASTSNVAQTSSAFKTKVGESVLAREAMSSLPRTSVSAITNLNLPQVPVKIGNTAIHPLGRSTESSTTTITTTTTSSSHATIAALSRSISSTVVVSPQNKKSLLKTNQRPATPSFIYRNSSVSSAIAATTRSADIADLMDPISEDATSQDSSTGLSEDDILQSAIQSILDADDLSGSESPNLFTKSNALDPVDGSVNNDSTSYVNQLGLFVGITDSATNTPESSSVSNTDPPPLVLISSSPKSDPLTQDASTSAQPHVYPSAFSDRPLDQEQHEASSERAASVEHVELSEDIPDTSLLSEDADPLNLDALESNEDSRDAPLFDDINVGLDSPPEDPLTITPTFNSDLPSESDPLTIDDLAADPLAIIDDSVSRSLTGSSPAPLSITAMRRSMSMVSNSDDESDSSTSGKGKKRGLMGYQLFRCGSCNLSFSNVQTFKSHLINAVSCKKSGIRQFQCVHCEKSLKTPQRLADHIQTHGVPRFTCSLCNEKFPTVGIGKLHMKNRHNIQQTNLIPLKSNRTNADIDEFMVKPGHANQPANKDKDGSFESPKQFVDETTFNPDQIDSIPIRQIFSNNVKCGKCNFQTKVRVNIVRHLQMHLEEKAVPDTTPVNPVPCLEKNEKMFDKMINLAASSFTTAASRMGGPNQEKEEENYPEYVPSHRRFVCSAHGCAYLCPEEGNLKHHLAALHSDDLEFVCFHCKTKIEPADPENVIKHLKLHGLHLYKCHYCNFVHHLKHKIEKHISDGHLDGVVKVVTVRYMESEPQEFRNSEEVATPPPTSSTKFKPWRCCMCKVKCLTKEDVQSHILHRHDLDTQYKCTLCAFKNDNEDSFKEHFKEKHPNHQIDIIFVYQKVEEETPKEDTSTPFDTTPLWQRDKPRVRHIRGILFDESSPQPIKSPKKPLKTYPGVKGSASSSSSTHRTSSNPSPGNKNLFDCIDAVARGSTETLKIANVVKEVGAKGDTKKGDILSPATKNSFDAQEKATSSVQKEDNEAGAGVVREDKQQKVDVDPPDSGNDDVIEVKQPPSIIVIDSEDSDDEAKPATKTEDSKTSPVSKTRGVKRQGTATDLLQEAVKMAKIEEPDDEDSVMVTNCSKEHLISMYGLFGSPHNKQWKCPKCHQFKSKRVGDFIFHIFKDFNVYRFKCKACSDLSITYKYMLDHITLHPGFTEDIIETLVPNVKLETWIHMVIREQSLAILKGSPLFKKPLTGPTDISCYFCPDKFMSMPDCCEHMLYHWVMMPYQCQHCPSEFYTVFDLKHHHKIEHPDLKLYVDPKGPTLTIALQCIENIKKKPVPRVQKKRAKADEANDTKDDDRDTVSGEVVNNSPKRRKQSKAASVSSSGVADVIRIDDDEDDLVIVSKTDDAVPNEDEVFACDACAHLADTEVMIVKHLLDYHGIKLSKFHRLSKKMAEVQSNQDMACNICSEVFPELKLRRHFLDNHLEGHTYSPYRFKCELCFKRYLTLPKVKMHFTRCHPGLVMQYECAIKVTSKISAPSKNKLYSCTMCAYTNIGPNPASIRAHLKGHLRSIMCNHCKVRFRYQSEIQAHTSKEHPKLQVDFMTLEAVQREFSETIREITKRATAVFESENPEKPKKWMPLKNVAKKSTSAPFMSPTTEEEEEEDGFSYYGIPGDDHDLSEISTTFELEGLEYTTTAEQMMKMFNMDSFVDVSDCAVDIIPIDKS